MKFITRVDIAKEISKDTGVSVSDIRSFVDTLLIEICEILADNNSIEIRGFGNFIPQKRKIANKSYFPRTHLIEPRLRFTPQFKNKVNNANKGGAVTSIF